MDLVQAIKQAAVDAVEAGKPTALVYGTVSGVKPLTVCIDQKLSISAPFLVTPKRMQDHTVLCVIDGENKEITVKNGLKVGETVLLLRMQGGQRFLLLDRVVKK